MWRNYTEQLLRQCESRLGVGRSGAGRSEIAPAGQFEIFGWR
jgi:hypothetical protein